MIEKRMHYLRVPVSEALQILDESLSGASPVGRGRLTC